MCPGDNEGHDPGRHDSVARRRARHCHGRARQEHGIASPDRKAVTSRPHDRIRLALAGRHIAFRSYPRLVLGGRNDVGVTENNHGDGMREMALDRCFLAPCDEYRQPRRHRSSDHMHRSSRARASPNRVRLTTRREARSGRLHQLAVPSGVTLWLSPPVLDCGVGSRSVGTVWPLPALLSVVPPAGVWFPSLVEVVCDASVGAEGSVF